MSSGRSERIVVVGLGYVGLPVAASFAAQGFDVCGVDKDADRAELLLLGADLSVLKLEPGLTELVRAGVHEGTLRPGTFRACQDANAIIVCVPTPVDENHQPDNEMLVEALKGVGLWMKCSTLVCIESTLAPGTMADVVNPILHDESGYDEGFIHTAYCPERLTPGRVLEDLRTMPRVIGGTTEAATERAAELYATLGAPIHKTDAATAEVVKVAENASRAVNIAFANELCSICGQYDVNFWGVRELINQRPDRNILKASPGVGGHCIPKDPWLLLAYERKQHWGSYDRLTRRALAINSEAAWGMANIAHKMLSPDTFLHGHTVAILGVAYKPNTDDVRNSPSLRLAELLGGRGATVRLYDPFVPAYKDNDDLSGVDLIVMAQPHSIFKHIDWDMLAGRVRHKKILACYDGFETPEGWEVRVLGVPE